MQPKSILLLTLALSCGVVASLGIKQVLAKRDSAGDPAGPAMASVLVAMENIPMGEPITAEMIAMEDWPEAKVPETAILKIEDVEGRRPKTELIAGMPIVSEQLLAIGQNVEGIAPSIPPGYRVVPVRVDATSGGASLILPRDRVDVLVLIAKNRAFEQTRAQTILQDICVYAVDDVFRMEQVDGERSMSAQTISLLLTPEQTETVMLASEIGKIRLSLRNAEDKEKAKLQGTGSEVLFEEGEIANRELDSTHVRPDGATAQPKSFLDMLSSARATMSGADSATNAPPVVAESRETFVMQMVQGSEVSKVVLNRDGSGEASKVDSWVVGGAEPQTPQAPSVPKLVMVDEEADQATETEKAEEADEPAAETTDTPVFRED